MIPLPRQHGQSLRWVPASLKRCGAPLDCARHHGVNVGLAEAAVRVGQVVVAGQLQHGDLGRIALVKLPVLQAPEQVALVVACIAVGT